MYLVKNNYGDVYRSECYDWALENAYIHERMKEKNTDYDTEYRKFVEELKENDPEVFDSDIEFYISGKGFEHPAAMIARLDALETCKYENFGIEDMACEDIVEEKIKALLAKHDIELDNNGYETPLFNANEQPKIWKELSEMMDKIQKAIERAEWIEKDEEEKEIE